MSPRHQLLHPKFYHVVQTHGNRFQIWPPLYVIYFFLLFRVFLFFFTNCGYMVGVVWERLERLYPLFLFYLLKVFPYTLIPSSLSASLFSAGCSWIMMAK